MSKIWNGVEPKIHIVVLDRGMVKVGYIYKHPSIAFHWRMDKCRIIRRWGTTNGLAVLVNGPLEGTVLDNVHNSSIPFRSVLDIIEVEESKWITYLR